MSARWCLSIKKVHFLSHFIMNRNLKLFQTILRRPVLKTFPAVHGELMKIQFCKSLDIRRQKPQKRLGSAFANVTRNARHRARQDTAMCSPHHFIFLLGKQRDSISWRPLYLGGTMRLISFQARPQHISHSIILSSPSLSSLIRGHV